MLTVFALLLFQFPVLEPEPPKAAPEPVAMVSNAAELPSAPSTELMSTADPATLSMASPNPAPAESLAYIAAARPIKPRRTVSTSMKRQWMILSAAQHGAASFDAWTTRHKIGSGGYKEVNPLLRPFAGNASLYAVVHIAPLAFDYLGMRFQRSDRKWLRSLWWLPQSAQTAVHLTCGATNLTK